MKVLYTNSRIFRAAGGGGTWKRASRAFVEAIWWARGAAPPMRGTVRGLPPPRAPLGHLPDPAHSRPREVAPLHRPLIVEEDLDLAGPPQPRDGVDGDPPP